MSESSSSSSSSSRRRRRRRRRERVQYWDNGGKNGRGWVGGP